MSSDASAPPPRRDAPRAPALPWLLPFADGYSYRRLGIALVLAMVLALTLEVVLRPLVGAQVARVVSQTALIAVFMTGLAQAPDGRTTRALVGTAARLFAVGLPVGWVVARWLS